MQVCWQILSQSGVSSQEELPLAHEALLPGSSTNRTQQTTSATYNSCTYLPKVWSSPLERPLTSQCPVLSDVKLKKLPFHNVLQELLKPSSLMAQGTIRFQANMSMFHLTSEQLTDIARSCDFQLGSNIDKYHWLIQFLANFHSSNLHFTTNKMHLTLCIGDTNAILFTRNLVRTRRLLSTQYFSDSEWKPMSSILSRNFHHQKDAIEACADYPFG